MMSNRVSLIDSFRFLAIMMVIVYHYCYRFSPPLALDNYYPYHFESSFFRYGFYGVQFFFVISGFVIVKTLESTSGFGSFFTKRLIRLLPSLFFCSIITFLLVAALDVDVKFPLLHASTLLCFVPSLTMTPPGFWNFILGTTQVTYVDGAYWSLFAEMVFYVLAATIYFYRPRTFVRNWAIFVLLITLARIVTSPKLQFIFPEQVNDLFFHVYHYYFLLTLNHLIYFSVGILFYHRYATQRYEPLPAAIVVLLILLEFYFVGDLILAVMLLFILLVFVVMIYRPNWLSILTNRKLIGVGLISYPLYLLHQNLGIVLIGKLAPVTRSLFDPKLLPVIVTAIMLLLAFVVYTLVEKPTSILFRKLLLQERNTG